MEVLLDEIGRRPGGLGDSGGIGSVAWAQERDGYALAAGLALGLVTLGSGRRALGLADLRIEDRLRSASVVPCCGRSSQDMSEAMAMAMAWATRFVEDRTQRQASWLVMKSTR